MRITSAGDVGIGTSAPAARLDVNGTGNFAGNGTNILIGNVGCGSPTAGIGIGAVTCNTFALGMDGSQNDTYINRPSGGKIHFREGNGTDQMSIAAGGNVEIGTLTPTAMLEVDTPGTSPSLIPFVVLPGDGVAGVCSKSACTGVVGASLVGGTGVYATSGFGGVALAAGGYGNGAIAGEFYGDVHIKGGLSVSGAITAGTKDFKIDHPLDPEGKYLYHASIESSEMMNLYTGNVVLDSRGEAQVEMPDWFETVNGDFRYQLTAVGGPGPGLYIAEKVHDNRFKIAGGGPGLEVSWQVTCVRHDPFARTHPMQVEEAKPEAERGTYLHPDAYGQPETKGVGWLKSQRRLQRSKSAELDKRAVAHSSGL
jgi:hypothetical protein